MFDRIDLPPVLGLRSAGPGHLVAVALVLIWLHTLDAAFVHPRVNASVFEHCALALLAIFGLPMVYVAYSPLNRAWSGAVATLAGYVALSVGAALHIAAVIRNEIWARSDVTGVAMTIAGAALLAVGISLLFLALPRLRYRLLMVPGVLITVMLVAVPIGAAIFVTHAPRAIVEPEDLGAAYEEVFFTTGDGLTLRGWYIPSQNGAAVAVVHGSGGARTSATEHVRMLVRHGYGVLAFDVRGHGMSDGATNAVGWGASADLAAAAGFLRSRPDVEAGHIGVLGLSMGAELAVESAANDGSFAAIVADGPSGRTFGDAADSSFPIPARITQLSSLFVFSVGVTLLGGDPPPPSLTSLSPRITQPVLYIASGEAARERALVTKIAERSGGAPELWVIEGAGHTEGIRKFPLEYDRRVSGFFERTLLSADPGTR